MKVPVKWLKDYVNIDITPKELGDALTLSGSNLEEVITAGEEIENVVTGKIMKIERHADAEKLVICQVDIAKDEPIQIVTAATNMKEQDIVPVALHGSTIHGGLKIKRGKLRGVASNGMFCSEEELGIAGDKLIEGLMIMPSDTPIGKDIKLVLGLDSSVLDFEITSNRPDCLSIVGMARETAATLGLKYKMPSLEYEVKNKENINSILKVDVKDDLCRRYIARGIKNVKIEPSPGWMQERLLQAGMRPINNIVDITNFVMMELGEPMHAFDAREITSRTIVVERASVGEKFITLDGVERILDGDMLNIKDGARTVGIAGIMGGLNSEVKDDTTDIIFECANFEGTNIRISSKKLDIRTEASSRFEKDLDASIAETAMNRACNLVAEIGAGEIMEGTIDIISEANSKKSVIEVDSNWVNIFLGTEISKEIMREYLERLDFIVDIKDEILMVTAPGFRIDIAIKEDIAEEIARIYGYNNIPVTVLQGSNIKGGKSKKQHLEEKIIESLIGSGLNQSINYSFVSPKVFDKILLPVSSDLRRVVTIRNPLGEDFSIMRTTALPSMMDSLERNFSRSNEKAKLFEIGKIYLPKENKATLPEERNILSIGMYGDVDYLNLKGVVENVIHSLGIDQFSFERISDNLSYHPGVAAALFIKKQYVGIMGEVHPEVANNYGISVAVYVAELNMDILYEVAKLDKKYKALPKFPAVTRDIAILVEEGVLVQQIEEIIKKQGGNIVENIKLFDVYKGKQIPEGKKSVAYSITYRKEDKTLTDIEVNKVHQKILRSLEYGLGAEFR